MSTEKAGGTPAEFDLSDEDLGLLDQLLEDEGIAGSGPDVIRPRGEAGPAPASYAQELFWLLDRATSGLTAYNMPTAWRLVGQLDIEALERALTGLVARHEALRTTFAADGDGPPVQVVHVPRPITLTRADVSALPDAERNAAAERLIRERVRVPFDLGRDFPFRALLVRVGDEAHLLVMESHHIVCDGWSFGIMLREMSELYRATAAREAPQLAPVALQLADYTTWQRRTLAGERLDALLAYWRGQLSDAPDGLALPTDFPRPSAQGFAGDHVVTQLPRALLDDLGRLARKYDVTLYMLLLAAYQTVLHRWSGQDDVIVGSAIAGRTGSETESIVGNLANTLVMRTRFAGDPTFGEVLARVRETAVGAYDHQDVPLEKLVLDLREGAERLTTAPLFQCVLTMQDPSAARLEFGDVRVEGASFEFGAAKFDLTLFPTEREDGLRMYLSYRSDLFTAATARRFLGHLQTLLESVVLAPDTRISALPLLPAEERATLAAWHETTADEGTATTLVALFEAQVARVPRRLAVVAGAATLTYQELNARANQLARHLQSSDVEPGAPVGLLLDRSADAIVGLLGILKCGAAYVPLAVSAPVARIAQQLGECGAKTVVTSAALSEKLPAGLDVVALDRDAAALGLLSEENVAAAATPETLAYVLYTSGSTGVPKGVAVTHANVVHYVRAVSAVLGVEADEPADGPVRQYGLVSTLAADLGNTALYPALLTGATLHILADQVTTEPEEFAQYMSTHRLDILKVTPNHLRALTAGRSGVALAKVLPRQWVITGGEALPTAFAHTLLGASSCRVLNHYGPTETTVGVLTHEVTAESLAGAAAQGGQTVPLGRPLSNTRAYVVDPSLRSGRAASEQPVVIPGELWIGGAGVAQGYYKRPDLTEERFVEYQGERVYRTGDRVRRLADGTIEFLGRVDDQVKVRGYRVELGEVETVLARHPGVDRAIVVLRVDDGVERLVGYVTPRSGGYSASHVDRPTSEGLIEWVAGELPAFMVPVVIVVLDALPLTPNGKVDRKALPGPDTTSAGGAYVEPATPTEAAIAAIWQDVLKQERVGSTDNFLDLGGHSLLAIRVLGRISRQFGLRLPLRALFDAPTVASLAAAIDAERAVGAPKDGGIGARSRDAFRITQPAPSGGSDGGAEGASR